MIILRKNITPTVSYSANCPCDGLQPPPTVDSFYDLEAPDIDGNILDFGEVFGGRVALITNVASYCGRTDSHYKESASKNHSHYF